MAKTFTSSIATPNTGDVLTASAYSSAITTLNNHTVPPACKATRSSDLSFTSATAIAWNSEDFDTDAMHDIVTNSTRVTVNTDGIYIVTLALSMIYTGTLTGANVELMKNGSTFSFTSLQSSRTSDLVSSYTGITTAVATDYFEAKVTISGATALIVKADTKCSFSAVWVGRTA